MAEEHVTENNELDSDEMDDWNADMIEDIAQAGTPPDFSSLRVYSRDWTIETIYSQIQQGNIDLNPKFQRRNAWNDDKKTRLIESLITGMPVPEIVFAEHPEEKRSFIVIDGKQRLLTIAGFMNPEIGYWKEPALIGKELTLRHDLDGLTFNQMENDSTYVNELRAFQNADVRCTVVDSADQSWDIFYNIFYRLNTGSVSLSSQELRQVRNKGLFADYLMEITSGLQPIHKILRCDGPDPRLRDAELILRFMVFVMFSNEYRGNLRKFLDEKMGYITENWREYNEEVKRVYSDFNRAIEKLEEILGSQNIGRIYPSSGKRGGRFNKALFEVEAYYFMHLDDEVIKSKKEQFTTEFEKFYEKNPAFRDSIRTSTSDPERYATRYKLFCEFINKTFETDIPVLPLPKK